MIEVSEAAQGTCGNLVWVDRPRVEKAGTPAGAVQNTLTPQKEPCYESKYLAEHKVSAAGEKRVLVLQGMRTQRS